MPHRLTIILAILTVFAILIFAFSSNQDPESTITLQRYTPADAICFQI